MQMYRGSGPNTRPNCCKVSGSLLVGRSVAAQLPRQGLDVARDLVVIEQQFLDLLDRVQHGGVVAAAETPADIG